MLCSGCPIIVPPDKHQPDNQNTRMTCANNQSGEKVSTKINRIFKEFSSDFLICLSVPGEFEIRMGMVGKMPPPDFTHADSSTFN